MDPLPLSLVHHVRPADGAVPHPPLLLLLHGVGANESDMARLAPSFHPRLLVLSVRAPIEMGPDSYGWFPVRFTPEGPRIDAAQAKAAWEAVARFAGEAVTSYAADPARILVAGFSQGGIMALAALLTQPELFAGAVAMSGRLLPEALAEAAPPHRLEGKPVLLVHGSGDTRLGPHYAVDAAERLRGMGVAVEHEVFPMGHEVTRESMAHVAGWVRARLDGAA